MTVRKLQIANIAGVRRRLILVVCVLAGLSVATPISAHHGAAEFDIARTVTLKGTVTEFAFTNPHSQVYFEVPSASGEPQIWQGELSAPNHLIRMGWNKRTLKPGDSVAISGYPVRGGGHAIWISKIVGPDGKRIPLYED